MPEREPLRLGIVGCGGISNVHAGAAAAIPETVRFVACCDVREDAARAWAQKYECPAVFTDYEEMVRKESLDGVLLATWPNQHREQIENCLAAGARSILCEKALTLAGNKALEILQMAREANAFVMEGFMYRHHPAIARLGRILAEGDLGPVDCVRAVFSAFDEEAAPADDASRNWRQRAECGGGIPHDFACYCVNACQHFAGGVPVRVYCRGDLSEKYGTMNRMYGMIEYDNGRVGIVQSSKKASFDQELEIGCARGFLRLPTAWVHYGDSEIEEKGSTGWGPYLVGTHAVGEADSYRLQLENFAGVVRGEAEPVVPLAESVLNTFTLEALVRSASEKRALDVFKCGEVPVELAKDTGRQPPMGADARR